MQWTVPREKTYPIDGGNVHVRFVLSVAGVPFTPLSKGKILSVAIINLEAPNEQGDLLGIVQQKLNTEFLGQYFDEI